MIAILVLVPLLQFSPASPAAKSSIEGTVVRAGTNVPVAGIRVTLNRPPEPRPATPAAQTRPPAAPPSATTDAQGKFILRDVDAGSYRLVFAGNGYVRQEYGQKIFPGQGIQLEVVAGQAVKNVLMTLAPTGSVSGRVFDSGKRPIAAIPVHVMRATYDSSGQRNLQPVASTQTDDRGEYRIYFLTPGKYILAAGTIRQAAPTRVVNGTVESHAMTYYPGLPDAGQSTPVDIKPGADLNLDIGIAAQSLFRVRGKVVDSRSGRFPSSLIIGLTPRGSSAGNSYQVMQEALSYDPADGTFILRDIAPGSYLVSATWGDSISIPASEMPGFGLAPPAPRQPGDPAQVQQNLDPPISALGVIREGIAFADLTVGNADVENLMLTIKPGGTVSGRIRMESAPGTAGPAPQVLLKPALDGLPATIPGVFAGRPAPMAADGSFSMANTKAGEYRVSVEPLPAGYYVREARIGPADVLNRPFQFTPGSDSAMDILITRGASSVQGTASNERLEAVPGSQVVLVPERARDRLDLYKSAVADARGGFTLSNVAPGDYRLFAWEALETNAHFNPDVLKQAESRGKLIHVQESSAQTVDIRVIPATPPF